MGVLYEEGSYIGGFDLGGGGIFGALGLWLGIEVVYSRKSLFDLILVSEAANDTFFVIGGFCV
jgi:hypothetical protein